MLIPQFFNTNHIILFSTSARHCICQRVTVQCSCSLWVCVYPYTYMYMSVLVILFNFVRTVIGISFAWFI